MLYDVIVMGCSPPAFRAAIRMARGGRRVAVVENLSDWTRNGRLPNEFITFELQYWLETAVSCKRYAREPELSGCGVRSLRHWLQRVARETYIAMKQELGELAVDVFPGRGTFNTNGELDVKTLWGEETHSAEQYLIATGTFEKTSVPGTISLADYLVSEEIGSEAEFHFRGNHRETRQIERALRLLEVTSTEGTSASRTCSKVLVGKRHGVTEGLGLENIGLFADDLGQLWCDDEMRTWEPNVYGLGSVVGFAGIDETRSHLGTLIEQLLYGPEQPAKVDIDEEREVRLDSENNVKSPVFLHSHDAKWRSNPPAAGIGIPSRLR